MRLRWSLQATIDANDIQRFLGERSPAGAARIRAEIARAGEQLIQFPQSGRPADRRDIREFVVARTPYLLIYRVVDDAIEVLRVLHGAQDRLPRA